MYGSVAEGGGRGVASGLRLKGRVCSMLTVMLGGFRLRVRVRCFVVRVMVMVRVKVRVRAMVACPLVHCGSCTSQSFQRIVSQSLHWANCLLGCRARLV